MVPESPAGRGTMRRPLLWDRQGSSPAFVLKMSLPAAGFLAWPSLLCGEMETGEARNPEGSVCWAGSMN